MRIEHRAARALIAFWIALIPAGPVAAQDESRGVVELTLPRPTASNEAAMLRLHVGALPIGARLRVTAADGSEIGVVTPFGQQQRRQGATYDLLLPESVTADGRVKVRVDVITPGEAPRPPTPQEMTGFELVYTPAAR